MFSVLAVLKLDVKRLLHVLGAEGKRRQFEAEDGGLQSRCLQPESRLKLISFVFKKDLEPSWHANQKQPEDTKQIETWRMVRMACILSFWNDCWCCLNLFCVLFELNLDC